MSLTQVRINQFRNITSANCSFSPSFNVFYGINGSGKTSLLEAIYYLGHGKSFRTHLGNQVIRHEEESFTLFGQVEDDGVPVKIGIERKRNQTTLIKMDDTRCASTSELALMLPIQMIGPDSYCVIEEGPKYRRRFLDWGLFHVEHLFFPLWKKYQHTLEQRNSALRSRLHVSQVQAWDEALASAADALDGFRQIYFQHFMQMLGEMLHDHDFLKQVSCRYLRGWAADEDFRDVLQRNISRDQQLGYTSQGAQRADLKFSVDGYPANEVLSRGQQKILVCLMSLAQGALCRKLANKQCLYLVDDLPAELDVKHREYLMAHLAALDAQVFVTGVECDDLQGLVADYSHQMFHVEHGVIEVAEAVLT